MVEFKFIATESRIVVHFRKSISDPDAPGETLSRTRDIVISPQVEDADVQSFAARAHGELVGLGVPGPRATKILQAFGDVLWASHEAQQAEEQQP
jgi:hypothetical protein